MRKKILVVGKESELQLLYEEELTDAGYMVKAVNTGEEALAALDDENPPDLVLLDIDMPGINGIEILRRLKTQKPKLPLVLLSAFPEIKRNLGSWASDAFVMKTRNLDELKNAVAELLI